MSCKSALYMANTTSQNVEVNEVINFGTPVRRFGGNINASAGNLVISGAGYYDIIANVNIVGGASAGDITVTLYKDGVEIPGATGIATTATDDFYTVTIPCVVRNTCCCDSTITAILTGVASIVSSATIKAERI